MGGGGSTQGLDLIGLSKRTFNPSREASEGMHLSLQNS